ncbi:MAG TPA: tripartite tricarboxylate transporter substrate binding protein [Reyranella sp.]|nr:tripartite tricarboxylate transporter substrate binding protein [Reyranella sp.]
MVSFMRRVFVGAAMPAVVAAAMVAVPPALAQGYPAKPIKIVLGAPPGGSSDVIVRTLSSGLSKRLGQPVIVENRPGASWLVATQYVMAAPPDGYTLLFTYSSPFSVLPFTYKKHLPYDHVAGWSAIAVLGEPFAGVMVGTQTPFKTLREYLDYAKANPGRLTHGSAGPGQLYSLAMDMLAREAGVDVKQVPFQGAAPAVQAILSSTVDSAYFDFATSAPFIQAGKIRMLAVAGKERAPAYPDVPTFAESGLPNLSIPTVWFGIVGPPKMPASIVERLNEALNEEMKAPQMTALFTTLQLKPVGGPPSMLSALIKSDIRSWGGLTKQLGISFD